MIVIRLGFALPGRVASSSEIEHLEKKLTPLSHGNEALQLIQEFLKSLGKVTARQRFLADKIFCPPITSENVRGTLDIEEFHMLQGDIIRSDAAYILGTRQVDDPSYVVASSTCDLVPGRRESALLLPIEPRRMTDFESEQKLKDAISNLVTFRSTRYIYLSALPDDEIDVLVNVAYLDPLAQCANDSLMMAERRASMRLIGWRMFGSLLRNIQVREAEDEATIRIVANRD
ncbi:MAG: hypothetical protein NVSMB52_19770 [Chloroflexota bacterium]